jgi:hypothetical protein
MDSTIIDKLGPCGISCEKCFAHANGAIRRSSINLKDSLGNFEIYAKRFSELLGEPVFNKYPDFSDLLNYFSSVDCQGCRKEQCKIFADCKVRDCHKSKGVDFCFQCPEFPCMNTGFDKHLYKRSVLINRRMKKIGIEEYYNEVRDEPRYK